MDVKQHASSKTRRQKRKDERKLKKLRRDCFYRRKTIPTQESLEAEELERQKQEMMRRQKIKDKLQQKEERREMEKAAEEAEEEKKKQLEIINKEDHKTLRELERKLKIKPKLNSWPSAFKNDHLDYILNYKDEAELLKSYVESGKDKKSRKRLHSSDEDNSLTSDEESLGSLKSGDSDEDSDSKEEMDDDSDARGSDAGSEVDLGVDDDDEESDDDDDDDDEEDDDEEEADKTEEDEEVSEDNENSDEDDDDVGGKMLKGKLASKKPPEAVKGILNEPKSKRGRHEKKAVSFDENSKEEVEEPKRKRSDALTEDIYGRLRDKEGNVVKDESKAFVPRGRRLQLQQQRDGEGMETLKVQISRIINRLHDKQMQMFSSQMENLFVLHSRADASEALTTELIKDSIKNELIKRNRAMDSMLLLAILHSKVGNEVSAVFLEALVAKFDEIFRTMDDGDGNETENQFENTVLLVTHLYQFKVVDCHLVYSIIEKLVSRFFVKDIHLLTLIWKEIGFCLRKDNPKVFQNVYLKTTEMVSAVDKKYAHKRVLSMQLSDILLAVKSNNPKKLVRDDEEELESRQKLLKTILSDSVNVPLHVSLDDLMSADQKGKWWLVGSAWAGSADSAELKRDVDEKTAESVPQAGDVNLTKLAQKLHMNTDIRKKILFVVVTSSNYREAFERVMKLSLTRRQDKDVIHVISTLCKRGKGNPFYTHLAETFRKYHRRFKKLPGISESRSTEEEMDFSL